MKLSPHFDSTEFTCKCGCGQTEIRASLLDRLEKLHDAMDARAIILSSGYRCPTHSVNVGGSKTDAHTKGFAADIRVRKQDGTYYNSLTIAEQAEKLGFGGIGMMANGYCHVDTRDVEFYPNSHWWADEVTGKNYTTFAGLGEAVTPRVSSTTNKEKEIVEVVKEVEVIKEVEKEVETKPITIEYGGETIFTGDVVVK